VKRRESGLLAVLLLAGTPAEAGLDASDRCVWHRETRWKAGDFVPSTNDTLEICRLEGDRPAVRIAGRGESCALRRARYRLSLPMRVSVRIRWSEPRFESAYPTAHLVWDPPEISDGWWERPMVGESGMGQWNGGRQGYLFHFPSASSGYSQHGVSERLETADGRHSFRSTEGEWTRLDFDLDRQGIIVRSGEADVARCGARLGEVRWFTLGFGDQTSTLVELDEIVLSAPPRQ